MTAETDEKKAPLCSFPLCGAKADWFTEFFGRTEYYCNRHKPMVPQAFLQTAGAGGTASSEDK